MNHTKRTATIAETGIGLGFAAKAVKAGQAAFRAILRRHRIRRDLRWLIDRPHLARDVGLTPDQVRDEYLLHGGRL